MNISLVSVSGRLPSDGSRLISSLLKREGHRVFNVYLARTEPDYSTAELEKLDLIFKDSDLAMLAVYSNYSRRAEKLTDLIHKRYPGLKVVWGGPHCISVTEMSLQYADAVCFSEGDQAVVEFVRRFERGEDYFTTPSMGFKKNGTFIVNGVFPPYTKLDILPFYDYGFEDQFLLDKELVPLQKEKMRELMEQYPVYVPILFFLTSRGCPHVCSYCNNCRYVAMFGRNTIRFYSVDRVIEELKHTLKTLGFIEFIAFGDDDFFSRPLSQIEEFALRYKNEIDLPFGIAVSARTYRKQKLEALLDHGLKAFNMGVQSGSQRVIGEVYNRRINLVKTKKAIEEIASYRQEKKISIIVDFIIDNPYETKKDIMKTFYYLLDLPDFVKPNLFYLSFFPGTPIYDKAIKDGIIKPFDSTQFRSYTRSGIRYQKNYETLLVLLLRIAKIHPKLRKIPKVVFKGLASPPMRAIASLFPESFYERACNALQLQKAWKKKKS